MKICKALLAGVVLLHATTAAAQIPAANSSQSSSEAGLPLLRNYTSQDYGFTNAFNSVAQDRRGVMYFGASLLYEYDGVTWRVTPLSGSNSSRSVATDATGQIWVGGNAGIGYGKVEADGSMQLVSLLDKIPPEHRAFNLVYQVVPTAQGVFFMSFERLFRWDGSRMQVWTPQTSFQGVSEVRGRVYVSQSGVGLQEVAGDSLRNLPGGTAWQNSRLVGVHLYDDRRVLVSARDEALMLYDGEKATPFPTKADEYLKSSELLTTKPLPDGGFCLNTVRGGAVLVRHDGQLRGIINQDAGLPSQTVNAAFVDRDGSLWLAHNLGITRVDINSPISVLARGGFTSAVRHEGTMYLASPQPGRLLFRLVSNTQTGVPALQPIPTAISGGAILLSVQDPTGKEPAQLLVGTNEGVMRLEGDTLIPAVPGLQGPAQLVVGGLLQSRKFPNRVYVGHGNGVSAIRREGRTWVDEGRLPNFTNAGAPAEDSDGALWLGTNVGVMRIEVPATGWRDAKVERFGEKEGLEPGGITLTIYAGHVFVSGSSQDIRRWDPSTRTFVPDKRFFLSVKNGQFDVERELDNGDVWAYNRSANEQRLGVFRRQTDGSFLLEEDPFRPLTRFVIRFVLAEPDGVLWWLGSDGVFRYDPKMVPSGVRPYFTLVRRVRSRAEAIVYDGGALETSVGPRLPYDRNSLSFQFAAPNFADEAGTSYQYLLEGADRDWSLWGKGTEANYNSLSPGSYRFRVRARNIEGRDGNEGVYAFAILPPWYRTWWAYALYVGLLGLAVLAVDRIQRRRLIGKERQRAEFAEARLRAEAAEKLAEAERERNLKIEQLSDIGREITASLDFDTIFGKLYERVNQLADADVFGVGLYHAERQEIEYRLAIEKGKRYAPYTRTTTDRNQFAVWCVENRQPVFINDVATEYRRYIEQHDLESRRLEDGTMSHPPQSLIYLPLISKEKVLGVFSIQSFEKNAYTEQHLHLMQNLASFTAIALDNASAYRQINEQEHENRRLFEEAQRARSLAEEADAAKSAFLSTVSHELRTPLTSVLGFAKIIKKRLDDRIFPLLAESDDRRVKQTIQQVEDNLRVVVSEGERLTKLIDDVLDLAKIEAGKLEWHMEPVTVNDVIEQATAATASLLEQKSLQLVKQRGCRASDDHRRSRSAHSGRDQLDLERGEVHRCRFGDLSRLRAGSRHRRQRHGHGHGHRTRRSTQGVRALQAGGRHADRQAQGYGSGPADLPRDRRASRRQGVGVQRARQGQHVLVLASDYRRRAAVVAARSGHRGSSTARPGGGQHAANERTAAPHPRRR